MSSDTTNFDTAEKVDVLIKSAFGFPSLDEKKQWFEEVNAPYNNYIIGSELFLDEIPKIPDFDTNGTVKSASDIGLDETTDFKSYSVDLSNKSACSIVDDSTGTIRRIRLLVLDVVPGLSTPGCSWYKLNSSSENIIKNALQFNYNKYKDGNTTIQPYSYTLNSELNTNLSDPILMGKAGGNWFIDIKSGILFFPDFSNFADNNINIATNSRLNLTTNKPALTIYTYIGRIGSSKMLTVGTNETNVTSPENSQIFVNTTDNTILRYDGSQWISIGGGGGGGSGFDATDNLNLNANFSVSGDTSLNDVSMNGNVDISGDLLITGNLSVIHQEDTTIINTTVNEYTSIVTEDISLNGKFQVSGDVSFNSTGRVDVCGNFYAQYPADSIPSSAIEGIQSIGQFDSDIDLSLNANLLLAGDASFNSNLYVNGNSTFKQQVDVCGNFYAQYPADSIPSSAIIGGVGSSSGFDATDNLNLNANFSVSGDTSLNDVSMNGNVDISGDLLITGNLSVINQENTTINTTVNEYTSIVTEDISLNGNLVVSANTLLQGDVSMNGNVDITGILTVNEYVTNVSTTNQTVYTDISNNGNLSVAGNATFSSTGQVDVCGNFYAQYPDDSIPSSAIIGGAGGGSGGGSVVNANGQTFFDIITQQPGKFTYDNSSNTTASLSIDWNYDDIKGKITDTAYQAFLNFQTNTATKNIPYMDELQIDISSSNASAPGWIPYETNNVSNADYHAPNYKTLTINKNTGIGSSYTNVLSSIEPFDIRVYGKNNAYNYPDEDTRALIFSGVSFKTPKAPGTPTYQITNVNNNSKLTITYNFIEPEIGDTSSPGKLKTSQVKYKENLTLSTTAYPLATNINTDEETDDNVIGGQNFTTVLTGLRAGTKYDFLTRINNDLIDTYSINDTDWGNVGSSVAFNTTNGPTPFTSLPGNYNIYSSGFTPVLSYTGTTNVTTSTLNNSNIIYINTASNQQVVPNNGNNQTFQISNQSANTDSTSGFGKYIDNQNDLVQVKAYVNNVEKQTLAYQGFQTGSTPSYGTATRSIHEVNYFNTPTQNDIYSDTNRKGYRLEGTFELLTISNNNVETYIGGASSTPYVLKMEFLRDSAKVGGNATTTITSNIYVDTLSGNPSASATTSTNTATVTDVVWTMGIPSVKKYKIDCTRTYSNINSSYGFIRGDRKLSAITAVTASSNSTNGTGFTSGSISIASISSDGIYAYDATTFKSANSNNLQSLHYTLARNSSNTTVSISETMYSLTSSGTSNNTTAEVSHHFDKGSYTGYGTSLSSKLSSLTDVYQMKDVSNLGSALGSITVAAYTSHETIPEDHTLLYYNGLFRTGGYPDVTAYTWNSVTSYNTYDAGSSGLTTSGSSTASGDKYKWIAFKLNKNSSTEYSFNGDTYNVKINGDGASFLSAVDMFFNTGLFGSSTISNLFDVNSTDAIGFCRATKSGTSTNVYGYFKNNFNTTQTWTNAGTNATGYSSLSSAKYGCYVQNESDYGIQVSSTAISDDLHVFIGLKI